MSRADSVAATTEPQAGQPARKLGRGWEVIGPQECPLMFRRTVAREAVDAIRLALEGANNDRAAVAVIRTILADGPPVRRDDTGSVKRLLRAIKRTPKARLKVT